MPVVYYRNTLNHPFSTLVMGIVGAALLVSATSVTIESTPLSSQKLVALSFPEPPPGKDDVLLNRSSSLSVDNLIAFAELRSEHKVNALLMSTRVARSVVYDQGEIDRLEEFERVNRLMANDYQNTAAADNKFMGTKQILLRLDSEIGKRLVYHYLAAKKQNTGTRSAAFKEPATKPFSRGTKSAGANDSVPTAKDGWEDEGGDQYQVRKRIVHSSLEIMKFNGSSAWSWLTGWTRLEKYAKEFFEAEVLHTLGIHFLSRNNKSVFNVNLADLSSHRYTPLDERTIFALLIRNILHAKRDRTGWVRNLPTANFAFVLPLGAFGEPPHTPDSIIPLLGMMKKSTTGKEDEKRKLESALLTALAEVISKEYGFSVGLAYSMGKRSRNGLSDQAMRAHRLWLTHLSSKQKYGFEKASFSVYEGVRFRKEAFDDINYALKAHSTASQTKTAGETKTTSSPDWRNNSILSFSSTNVGSTSEAEFFSTVVNKISEWDMNEEEGEKLAKDSYLGLAFETKPSWENGANVRDVVGYSAQRGINKQ